MILADFPTGSGLNHVHCWKSGKIFMHRWQIDIFLGKILESFPKIVEPVNIYSKS